MSALPVRAGLVLSRRSTKVCSVIVQLYGERVHACDLCPPRLQQDAHVRVLPRRHERPPVLIKYIYHPYVSFTWNVNSRCGCTGVVSPPASCRLCSATDWETIRGCHGRGCHGRRRQNKPVPGPWMWSGNDLIHRLGHDQREPEFILIGFKHPFYAFFCKLHAGFLHHF